MSKEKKDLLKAILANTELIMEHLKIKQVIKMGAPAKTVTKKPLSKATASKKPAVKNPKTK